MQIEERLEKLLDKIYSPDFIQGRGLGNEVPFWILDYPPENELVVRYFINRTILQSKDRSLSILEIDLYKLSLKILNEKGHLEKVLDLENKKTSEYLFSKLKSSISTEKINNEIKTMLEEFSPDLIFITGVGKIWPIIRSHKLLNHLQIVVENITLIMFYPGVYGGNDLRFFGKFTDGNYYRAFRLVPDEPGE